MSNYYRCYCNILWLLYIGHISALEALFPGTHHDAAYKLLWGSSSNHQIHGLLDWCFLIQVLASLEIQSAVHILTFYFSMFVWQWRFVEELCRLFIKLCAAWVLWRRWKHSLCVNLITLARSECVYCTYCIVACCRCTLHIYIHIVLYCINLVRIKLLFLCYAAGTESVPPTRSA